MERGSEDEEEEDVRRFNFLFTNSMFVYNDCEEAMCIMIQDGAIWVMTPMIWVHTKVGRTKSNGNDHDMLKASAHVRDNEILWTYACMLPSSSVLVTVPRSHIVFYGLRYNVYHLRNVPHLPLLYFCSRHLVFG
jgi:hypothetical protein